jgi:hypothetical protein
MKRKPLRYYDLYPLSRTPGYPEARWYRNSEGTWRCPVCYDALSRRGPIDAHLAHPPDNAAINFVSGVGIGYAQVALLEAIREAIGEENAGDSGAGARLGPLWLGGVYDAQGRRLEDYATFRAEELLFIRGRQLEGVYGSKFRRCPECGRLLYHPMGDRYIVKSELTGARVYESQLNGLVVDEGVYLALRGRAWRKLGRWGIPVEDVEPADRLTLHPFREDAPGA